MSLVVDKKRSIGAASKEVGVQEHVIRFWETQFPDYIKPTLGAGGRRYFFDKDIKVLMVIKDYLYEKGYTIKGLQNLFKNENVVLEKDVKEVTTDSFVNQNNIPTVSTINKSKMLSFKEDLLNFYNKLKNI